jgi:hypothetical protein
VYVASNETIVGDAKIAAAQDEFTTCMKAELGEEYVGKNRGRL